MLEHTIHAQMTITLREKGIASVLMVRVQVMVVVLSWRGLFSALLANCNTTRGRSTQRALRWISWPPERLSPAIASAQCSRYRSNRAIMPPVAAGNGLSSLRHYGAGFVNRFQDHAEAAISKPQLLTVASSQYIGPSTTHMTGSQQLDACKHPDPHRSRSASGGSSRPSCAAATCLRRSTGT